MKPDYLAEHLPAFARALEIAEREARALDASWQWLNTASPSLEHLKNLDPAASLAVGIEAFASRFARLQDHVGEKLLPRLLILLGESPGPMLDNLNRAERLGLIEDALAWPAWRNLRNRLVHEYLQDPKLFAQALQQALTAAPQLIAMVKALRQAAIDKGTPLA